jgi:hypothetical protein
MHIQGTGTSAESHPDTLGNADATKHNFGQRIPYFSEVWRKDPRMAAAVDDALEDIGRCVETLVQTHLPDQFSEIKTFLHVLPLNHNCTTYPFSSWCINIQVATEGHLDNEDKIICVTIPFGDFKHGQLVFYEAGIVVDLVMGDIIIFPSGRLTHFNLDYEGTRCSLVLFTDKQGDEWVKSRNGWAHHMVTSNDASSSVLN